MTPQQPQNTDLKAQQRQLKQEKTINPWRSQIFHSLSDYKMRSNRHSIRTGTRWRSTILIIRAHKQQGQFLTDKECKRGLRLKTLTDRARRINMGRSIALSEISVIKRRAVLRSGVRGSMLRSRCRPRGVPMFRIFQMRLSICTMCRINQWKIFRTCNHQIQNNHRVVTWCRMTLKIIISNMWRQDKLYNQSE